MAGYLDWTHLQTTLRVESEMVDIETGEVVEQEEDDDRPWIAADPKGSLNVMLLRRIAYNMLALFRAVTQRSEEKRMTPWKDLLRWVYNTLIAAQETDLAGLRERTAVTAEI